MAQAKRVPQPAKTAKPVKNNLERSDEDSDLEEEEEGEAQLEEPPRSINPYEILVLEKEATVEHIRSAYKKAALKHHPDKASAEDKETAHQRFQEIAFAYAILSDPRRKSRYDITGSTEESLDADDDFNWSDFFRAQFEDVVSTDKIAEFKEQYQGSEEERKDVIDAYIEAKGDLNILFQVVMLSNPLEDESRYRKWIDEDIKAEKIKAFKAYTHESAKSKKARRAEAEGEAKEAEEYAKELGVHEKLFGNGASTGVKRGKKKGAGGQGDESALAALIQQRQKARAGNFLAGLEEKYTKQSNGKGVGKRKRTEPHDEPSEEAFARNRSKVKKK